MTATSEHAEVAPTTLAEREATLTERQAERGPLLSAPALVVPFVVAAVALAFAAYSPSKALLVAFVSGVLVVLAAIDVEHRVVPNRIVLPAAGVALLGRFALVPGDAAQYVVAALLAAVFLFIPRLFSANSIGMGDVKLGLLIGAALGWGAASALALGFLLVFPVALVIAIRGGVAATRHTAIPMCPFLALGALVVLLGPAFTG